MLDHARRQPCSRRGFGAKSLAAWAFLAAMPSAALASGSSSKGKPQAPIKLLVREKGWAQVQYSVAPQSPLGKRLWAWYDSLPLKNFKRDSFTSYAPGSIMIYFSDRANANIGTSSIVIKKPGIFFSNQLVANFPEDDAVLATIKSLIEQVQKEIPKDEAD